ncbi:MAG TPA: HD domain-containing protein [Chitinophagaceae bacterium]|jgi:(p)ppGpp synthase/HD superfamily hydrolase|nr:HD domain-containing protein [Chitinophagaceae bacterium]
MDSKLGLVRDFAALAHEGQQRRYTPDPYIVHPVRVMELCAFHGADRCIQYAALLHDVLEDTDVTLEQMQIFLHSVLGTEDAVRTLGLVVELTDVYTKAHYPGWNRQKRRQKEAQRLGRTSAGAQTIKYADIIDNCNGIAKHDPDFGPLFLHECTLVLDRIREGNSALHEQARRTVQEEQHSLMMVKEYNKRHTA